MQPSKQIQKQYPKPNDFINMIRANRIPTLSALADHFEISFNTLGRLIESYGLTKEWVKDLMASDEIQEKTVEDFCKFRGLRSGNDVIRFVFDGVQFFIHDANVVYRATKTSFKEVRLEYRERGNPTMMYFRGDGTRKHVQYIRFMYMAQSQKAIPDGYKVVLFNPNVFSYHISNLKLVKKRSRKSTSLDQLGLDCEALWMVGEYDKAQRLFADYMNKRCREKVEKDAGVSGR